MAGSGSVAGDPRHGRLLACCSERGWRGRRDHSPPPAPHHPLNNLRPASLLTVCGGGVSLLLLALALLADSHTMQVLGAHLASLRSEERSVVLSFDDGPNPESTAAILSVLRSRGVPASFYLIGQRIDRYPALATRIVQDGHEVGNHSYSHPRMVLEHPRTYAHEIDRTDQRIRALGYRGTIDFRPPYGQKLVVLPWLLARRQKLSVLWNVDSRDWIDRDPESIARRVTRLARPGAIVLLHDGPLTARALPAILDGLQKRGFRFRTVRSVAPVPTPQVATAEAAIRGGLEAPQAGESAQPTGPAKRMSRLRR